MLTAISPSPPALARGAPIDFKQTTVYIRAVVADRRRRVKGAQRKSTEGSSAQSRRHKPAVSRARRSTATPAVSLSVRDRILHAAEHLFAEHGMSGVGLRAITAAAKVNLASIAYHFGSKDGLLEALFAMRAAPIAVERDAPARSGGSTGRRHADARADPRRLRAPCPDDRPAVAAGRPGLRTTARAARHRAGKARAQAPGEGVRPIEPALHRRDRQGAAGHRRAPRSSGASISCSASCSTPWPTAAASRR